MITLPENTTSVLPVRLHGLDHLRAFAISSVFLFHYYILTKGQPEWLPDFASFGWTGVDLFFVLSGFLISDQLFLNIRQGYGISLRTFFLKRFFRIIPAFGVTLALYFCIPVFREKEALPPLWKFLTFTQNLGLNLQEYGTFSHAWSLCVEEHFYLFFPLVLLFLLRFNFFNTAYGLIGALVILGFVCRMHSFTALYEPHAEARNSWMYWYKYIYYPTYNRLDGFLAGISIAAMSWFTPRIWAILSRYGNLWLIVGLLVLAGAYGLCEDPHTYEASVWGFPLIAAGYGLLVLGAVSPSSVLYNVPSKITRFISAISYAVYLTHKGVIHVTHHFAAGFDTDPNSMLVVCILTCGLVAYALHRWVEKPFIQLGRRINPANRVHRASEKVGHTEEIPS